MISPADAEKMNAQLESILAEISATKARMNVLAAEIARLKEKLL